MGGKFLLFPPVELPIIKGLFVSQSYAGWNLAFVADSSISDRCKGRRQTKNHHLWRSSLYVPVSYAGWSLTFLQGSPILGRSKGRRQRLRERPLCIHISVTHSDSLATSIIWGPEKNSFLGKA